MLFISVQSSNTKDKEILKSTFNIRGEGRLSKGNGKIDTT